jgi:small-conductance mechanosensitive channel
MGVTGRIVVFPNAVFFQPSAMFKQLPGIQYTWHAVSVTLSRDCDHALAEKRIMAAVESVYGDYRAAVEGQYEAARTSLNLHTEVPRPEARIRFVDSGLEIAVRYPVEIGSAGATDDRIARELLELIAKEPDLKRQITGSPKIQALL